MAVGIHHLLGTLVIVFLLPHCSSKKILMLPLQFPSLVSAHQSLGKALMEKGHEVSMVIPPSLPNFDKFSQGKIKIFTHEVTEYDMYKEAANADREDLEEMFGLYYTQVVRYMADGYVYFSRDAVKDQKLMAALKNEKFDIAVVDGSVATRLYYLIPYILDIPYVSLTCERDLWVMRNTDPPSHVPFVLGSQHTNEMDFWQRLDNTLRVVSYSCEISRNRPYGFKKIAK